jgi:DNA primase
MKKPLLNDHIKEQIRDAADIVDVVSDYVKLKRSGNSFTGLCPFHNEKSPSFHVNPQLRIYKCFGCGAGGDVFNFVMEMEGVGFVEAMKTLAERYRIDIPEIESDESDDRYQLTEGIYHALRFAGVHFHNNLSETDEAQFARDYLKKRGFTNRTVRKFGVGYALNSFDGLLNDARSAGIREEYLAEAGLIKYQETGKKAFDIFRGRLMFPIFNPAGKVIAFGGRILQDDKGPKYINSPQTKVYNKSEALYGVQLAKNEIRREQESILVEGYTDVISLWQAGIGNAVASSGTALTIAQLRMLKRYSPNLLMLYDADSAGQSAMLRGVELALQEGLDVRMLGLPEGEDPDSFVRKFGAEAFRNLRKTDALDFVSYMVRQAEKDGSWDDPINKHNVISAIIGMIALMPNEVSRETMVLHLNKYARIGDRALFNQLGLILTENERRQAASSRYRSGGEEANRPGVESGSVPLQEPPPVDAYESDTSSVAAAGAGRGKSVSERVAQPGRKINTPGYEKEIIRLMLTYGERMVDYIGSLCNSDHFEDPSIREFYDDIISRYTNDLDFGIEHYTERESPYPSLTAGIMMERYSVSEQGNRKRGVNVIKDTDPFKTARGALKTLKINYLKRLHDKLGTDMNTSGDSGTEELIKKQYLVRKELTRYESLAAEDLFPKET